MTAAHITAHPITSSLTSIADISIIRISLFMNYRKSDFRSSKLNLFATTYFVHAKSTGELGLISFGFSDRSV